MQGNMMKDGSTQGWRHYYPPTAKRAASCLIARGVTWTAVAGLARRTSAASNASLPLALSDFFHSLAVLPTPSRSNPPPPHISFFFIIIILQSFPVAIFLLLLMERKLGPKPPLERRPFSAATPATFWAAPRCGNASCPAFGVGWRLTV